MNKNIHSLIVILLTIFISSCTTYNMQMGDAQYDAFGYKKAARYYEKVVVKEKKTKTIEKLADCYFRINDYNNAEKHFRDAFFDKNCTNISRVHFAQTLMCLGNYDEAKVYLNEILAKEPEHALAKALLVSCNSVHELTKDTIRYSVGGVDIKGFETTFSPVHFKDGLVFSGEKSQWGRRKTYNGTLNGYQNLYFVKKDSAGNFSEAENLSGIQNKQIHNSSATFDDKLQDIYFSSVEAEKPKLSEKYTKTYYTVIKHYILLGTKWDRGIDFPYNKAGFSNAQPALSPDGQTMFFASDIPGGFGGSDLYVATSENGVWSLPINLGAEINTAGNECFPVVGIDKKLYFSSNGHRGIGGLDIFSAEINGTKVTKPTSLNYPINSKADDFGMLWNKDLKGGYITSNRSGKSDRIYSFTLNPYNVTAIGKVISKESGSGMKDVTVVFRNKTTDAVDSVQTDSEGKYSFVLLNDCEYIIEASKHGYFTVKNENVNTKNIAENKSIDNNFMLQEMVLNKPIVIEGGNGKGAILYDVNKAEIRKDAIPEFDKLIKLLKDNPTIKVELSSHTDSRADDDYNQKLSERRSKAVYDYLAKNGINKRRMAAKGYGETKLVNKCGNGVECTDEEHQQNRRTEIKVVKDTQKRDDLSRLAKELLSIKKRKAKN